MVMVMKLVKISDLFEVSYGNSLELSGRKQSINGINFVSRTSKNNGVSAKIQALSSTPPFSKGMITVSCGGSVLETFLQPEDFYTGYHVMCLQEKYNMTEQEKLLYCTFIKSNKYKYSYGRQANKTLSDIKIPDLSFVRKKLLKIDIKQPTSKELLNVKKDIDIFSWKYFKINKIFSYFEKGKCGNASSLKNGNDIDYIGAKKDNNGLMRTVCYDDKLISNGNCIVLIGDGQGSVGYSLYQNKSFIGSTTLTMAYNKKLNKYNAMFLVSILDKEKFRYSFGRKYGKTVIEKSKIKLPATKDGNPDWQFMEDYIKSLPYSASL